MLDGIWDNKTIVFGACALGSFLVLCWMVLSGSRRRTVEDRLDNLSADARLSVPDAHPAKGKPKPPPRSDDRERRTLADRLVQAGLYKRQSLSFYIATQIIMVSIPIVLAIVVATFGYLPKTHAAFVGLVTGISGVIAPGFWLDSKKKRRQTKIRRSIPDALDVIVVCLEAGLSLPAAFVRVAKDLSDAHPLLAREMTIVHREVQMGSSTGKALYRFAERFDLEELRGLATVVGQTEKFGASVVNALRVHAESLRGKRSQRARENAQKAGIKLLFPTVFCIFPALFVVILGPAAFDIYKMLESVRY